MIILIRTINLIIIMGKKDKDVPNLPTKTEILRYQNKLLKNQKTNKFLSILF